MHLSLKGAKGDHLGCMRPTAGQIEKRNPLGRVTPSDGRSFRMNLSLKAAWPSIVDVACRVAPSDGKLQNEPQLNATDTRADRRSGKVESEKCKLPRDAAKPDKVLSSKR